MAPDRNLTGQCRDCNDLPESHAAQRTSLIAPEDKSRIALCENCHWKWLPDDLFHSAINCMIPLETDIT
ncbi:MULTISPECIES: hypothetical protein [Aquitalea]|uniref:hypothetical protein n=1 Tax=Aquitalea TaxID=407217 RepID=UPI0013574E88|nr:MULTISPECIES: hypothetical protein [Aquitalea]